MEKAKEISERGPIKVVADAAVVIVIEKLKKLKLTKEVSLCPSLKGRVDYVTPKLKSVYEFLKDKCWRESHSEWTDRLLRTIYDVEDKIDIFTYRIVRQEQQTIGIAPDVLMTIWWKCLFHIEMKRFIKQVDELLQDQHLDRDPNKSANGSNPLEDLKQTIPESQYYQRWQKVNAQGEDPAYIGSYRSKDYEKVIQQLLKPKPTELYGKAIYGDEGSGKTYLARRVFNDFRIRKRFERRAWVHVMDTLTLKDIRYEVLKQVKAPDRVLKNREHMDEEGVSQALVEELNDKGYLIVLDDFYNEDTWYELIRYLPDWSKGSRVLVTTRSRHIAYVTTDYKDPIKLKNLEEEGSKKLLQKKVKPEMPDLQDDDIHANEKYKSKCSEEDIDWILKGAAELSGRAIYGDDGLSKTYFVESIFNDSRIMKHFKHRALVHVTNTHTLKDIWYEVLKQVKGPDNVLESRERMDEEGLKKALLEELYDKSYLVVLENFYNCDTWYALINFLPEWYKTSRILVTTQSKYTAYVTTDYRLPIRLINLGSQEDSKKPLQEKMKPEMPDLQDEDIHAKIFQASNGLPLAVALLGGPLGELLLNSSHKDKPLQIEKVSLPDILTLSYNNLPQEEKPCFLYLTLSPKATPIPVRRILQLWLAEGLLTGSDKTSPEDIGVKYLEDLIMRNLVEVVSWKPDGTPWTCQVVTSMYDMFYPQAVDVGLLRIHNKKKRDTDPSHTEPVRYKGLQFKVRWLAEHSNIKNFCQSDSYLIKHMRSFISFYTRKGIITKDLGTFLRTVTSHNSFRLLRVLDLEGVYKPYLHDTIGRLVLLKYLGLRSTVLDTLPSCVGCLSKLETLDIKNTNITNLAESLWKSGCLRHLYLNGFHVDPKILRHSARFLKNLRTLSGLYVGNINESLVSDLIAFVTNLTKLKIYYKSTEKPDSITRWISKLTNLHSLKLGIISGEKKEKSGNISSEKIEKSSNISGKKKEKLDNREKDSVQLPNLTYLPEHHHLFNLYLLGKLPKLNANQLPSCLRVFTLSMSELSDDPMPSLGKLLNLRTLRLLANSYTGAKMSCLTEGFPRLKVLKLWSLTKLQQLTVGKGCMDNLKELEIRDCAELKFESDIGLEHLRSLKELILTKMPEASIANARKVKLPNNCLFFESGTIKPSNTQHEDVPPTQSPHKINRTEEVPAPSLTSANQMDGDNKEPSSMVSVAALAVGGQGGANPFALSH